jgi:hypothetical protein
MPTERLPGSERRPQELRANSHSVGCYSPCPGRDLIHTQYKLINARIPKEYRERDSVHMAKVGKLDNINSSFARLNLRHERGVRSEFSSDLRLCESRIFPSLPQCSQQLLVFLSVPGFPHS